MHPLVAYASQFMELTADEVRVIEEEIIIATYKKGTILLREGDISRECFFILKGCIRQFQQINGEEKTTAFYTEYEPVVSFTSYAQEIPATHGFACVEETTTVVGTPESEAELYSKFPRFESLTRVLMGQDHGKTQELLATFITSSPEERYLHLLTNRPQLLQRVPQHQIASYIGMTPESLSRMKRRILKK